jgi:hypothetical protein
MQTHVRRASEAGVDLSVLPTRTTRSAWSQWLVIADIDAGPVSFTVSSMSRTADQSAVDFARELLHEVQVHAAEVERLHVKPTGPAPVGVAGEAA